jgi:enoyl-CoA hydratase/carnithine racemase
MSAELLSERQDTTLILTMSNPSARNALHPDMVAAAIETLSTAERDDGIRTVILTGANGYFCPGRNLNALLENRAIDPLEQVDSIDNLHGWIEAIRNCPKPVIAAIEGGAAGSGFSLALACDLIVAGSSAKFIMSNVKMGLTPDGGASWLLTQALPRQFITEILLEGASIPVKRLHDLGIVNRISPDGSALAAALLWAGQLALLPATSIERIKSLMNEAQGNLLTQQFEAEKHSFIESLRHREAQEGIHAFLEKRKPRYQ